MGEKRQSERIAWIDNARALSMLFIVIGHTISEGFIHFYLYSFHVPIFFFLSGVTFSTKKRPSEYIKDKFKRLLIPYWIFSCISIVFYIFLGNAVLKNMSSNREMLSLKECLLGMLIGSRNNGLMDWNRPLWFLPCLFVLLVAAYFIKKYVMRNSEKLYPSLIALAVSVAVFFVMRNFNQIPELPFGILQAVSAAPFFIAGAITKKIMDGGHPIKLHVALRALIAAGSIVLGAYISTLNTEAVGFATHQFGIPWIYLISASVSVFGWCMLASTFEFKPIAYVGRNTLPILLMHKFPILFFSFFVNADENAFVGIAVAVVSLIMCVAVGEVIKKICPFVLGEEKGKKER